MTGGVVPSRTLRALLVDVGPTRRGEIAAALQDAGWSLHAEPASGTDELTAALARRGWDVVIYGGEGDEPVPARKAMALVRMSDPQLAFVAAVPSVRPGDLSAFVQGFGPEAIIVPDPARLPEVLEHALAAAHDARPDADSAHRLLLAQQAITDHVAAGLAPDELCERVLATLGETLGWTYGAVWRPDGGAGMLRVTAVWHDPAGDPDVDAFARVSRRLKIAPGRGLPGRAYAFRRPAWVDDVRADGNMPRHTHALRAGLTTAVAFPIALADDCAGVIEFFSADIREPDAQVVALFATVGGQLAQYLERRRLQADESRRVEAMLRAERDRAQRYLDVAGTMIVVLDANGEILLINRKGCSMLDRAEDELLGRDWFGIALPEQERAARRSRFEALIRGEADPNARIESAILTQGGELRMVAWNHTVLHDADGTVVGTLSSGEDVTERQRAEQQITYLAYHDTLTGLANRTLLEEHLKLALARSRRTGAAVALLQLDVDNFKLVNDSLGHGAGDELICRLAARLEESVRATDLLARTGGDGFLLLLSDLHDDPVAIAEQVAAQIVDCLAEPFMVAGAEFQISASIGIALSPRDARDAEALLAHADAAMYHAKEVARGSWAVYAQSGRDPLERLSMAARLRRALSCDEFELHYQPIFDTASREVVAVEALLRWYDRERGARVPPSEFIPVAEETGLIESIGDWVFGAVCAQQVAWAARGLKPQISVNVSPRQLRRVDFLGRVDEHLRASGADPERIIIELTESAMLQDQSDAEPVLRELHELGLRLALDDFGAGYSSLSRLREMPMDTLKIDRAFLRAVPENPEAAAIVTAILSLARALGRHVVAEGVETEEQRRFLEQQQCPLVQGFLLARPMPVDEVEGLLATELAPTG
jgi:diguanylate cyclase (GGDEF)-like protein/PAS domain S-box-containing protein